MITLAAADVVHLKNGNVLEGNITKETDDVIVLEMSSMTMTVSRSQVDRIEREETRNLALGRAQNFERQRKYLEAIEEYAQARKDEASRNEATLGINRCRESFCADYRKQHHELFQQHDYDALLRQVDEDLNRLGAGAAARQAFGEIQSDLYIQKSRILMDRMDFSGAERLLASAAAVNPDSPGVLLEHARLLVRMKRWDTARSTLEKAMGKEGAPAEVKLMLMQVYFASGDTERGLAAFEHLYGPGADSGGSQEMLIRYKEECAYFIGQGYKQRAEALAGQEQIHPALEYYRFGAQMMPETAESLKRDIAFYQRLGATKDAQAAAERLPLVQYQEELSQRVRVSIASEASTFAPSISGASGSGGKMTASSLETALARARQNDRKVLLIFTTDWCGNCKKLKKDILPAGEVRGPLGKYVVTDLDAEKEGRSLAGRYRVSGYPTLIVLDSSGRELKRMAGVPSTPADMAAWLQ